jgi:predicted dehydrogenase
VLRLGIIGAGQLSSTRIYPCLHSLPVTLTAVCDLDESLAKRNARLFGAKAVYTDHLKMLDSGEIDAVIVAVGPKGHPGLAIDVMEAGLPVYTEKPPAVTASDAHAMLDASLRTGQICMTAFQKRFAPAYEKARLAAHSSDFGPPSLLAIDWCSPAWWTHDPHDPVTWFLLDFCIHIVDLSRYMFGEVVEVYARKRDEVAYAVTLVFANGAVGVLGLSANRDGKLLESVELTGRAGQFITIDDGRRMVRYGGNEIVDLHETPFAIVDSLVEAGYQRELAEFVAAIGDRREPESSIASSYQTMRLYEAIDRSAKERRVVQLDESE